MVLPAEAVVIEVRAAGGPLADAAESCSGVLGKGRCRAIDGQAAPGGPRFRVVVVFDDETQQTARIELHEAPGDAPRASRSVGFAPDDTLVERYRAIGLIAAAQVLSIEPDLARKPAEPRQPSRPAPGEAQRAAPSGPERRNPWGLDLAGVAGSGLDRGAPRFGALARPFWAPFGPVAFELGLRFAARPDDPFVSWSSISLGASLRLSPRAFPLGIRLRAGARGSLLVASTDAAGESDSSSAFQLGPELGAELSWPEGATAAAFAGGELELPRPRLRVEVRGREAGQVPSVVAGGLLGVRLRL